MRSLVINSHVDSTTALARLMDSLQAATGFDRTHIKIVVGGCTDATDEHSIYSVSTDATRPNIEWIRTRRDSIDFTALLACIDLFGHRPADEYFYIHDTCVVDVSFFKRIGDISLAQGQMSRSIGRLHMSMNMGIYTQSWLTTFQSQTELFRNTDGCRAQFKRRCIDMEDWFFRNDPTNTVIGAGLTEVLPPTDVYGRGVMRRGEVYRDVGLTKWKANWCLRTDGAYQLGN